MSTKTSSIEKSSTSGEKFWQILKNFLEISRYLTTSAETKLTLGQILNASYVRAPVLIPIFFASRLEAIIQVLPFAAVTPIGFPRNRGFSCCSTLAKNES